MAMSRFAEITALEHEVGDLTDQLATRKAIERAKGLLQEALSITEPEAFRWIQRTAMDLRLTMLQVAQGVIDHGPELGSPSGQ
jgi:response regulator NasT